MYSRPAIGRRDVYVSSQDRHFYAVDKKTGAVSVKVTPAYSINLSLRAADGTPIEQTVWATVNSVPKCRPWLFLFHRAELCHTPRR